MPETKRDVDLTTMLALWMRDQEAKPVDGAIAMARLLGLLVGHASEDVADLEDGLDKLRAVIDAEARQAFIKGPRR